MDGNRALQILAQVENDGYGILAHACYDAQMAVGLIRAAERARSPAIIQFFPPPFTYGRVPFFRLFLDHECGAYVDFALYEPRIVWAIN